MVSGGNARTTSSPVGCNKRASRHPRGADASVVVHGARRAHITAFRMARDLGFFIADAHRQYIAGVEEGKLSEIRQELGLLDLVLQENESDEDRDHENIGTQLLE